MQEKSIYICVFFLQAFDKIAHLDSVIKSLIVITYLCNVILEEYFNQK